VRAPVQSAHWQDALQVKAGAALTVLVLKLRVKGVLGANAEAVAAKARTTPTVVVEKRILFSYFLKDLCG